ncbi:MAG: divalent-cation tolerance protein CutA [Candidatus Zixiibacteriota bacterium]
MESVRIVYISIPRDEAEKMAMALVERRLAACINVVPRIHSYFWWDDAVQTDEESMLIVKTTKQKFQALMEYVIENHPYELPEIIALPLVAAFPDYINWVKTETNKP